MDYIAEHKKMWQSFIDNFSEDKLYPMFQTHKEQYLLSIGIESLTNDCFLCEYSYQINKGKKIVDDEEYCKNCSLKRSCYNSNSLYDKIYRLHSTLYGQYATKGHCNKKDVERYLELLKLMRDMEG